MQRFMMFSNVFCFPPAQYQLPSDVPVPERNRLLISYGRTQRIVALVPVLHEPTSCSIFASAMSSQVSFRISSVFVSASSRQDTVNAWARHCGKRTVRKTILISSSCPYSFASFNTCNRPSCAASLPFHLFPFLQRLPSRFSSGYSVSIFNWSDVTACQIRRALSL